MILIFDTETTGVPKDNYNDWSQCYLIQIGWLLIAKNKIVKQQIYTIKSEHKSTPESLSIHNISDEYREQNGIEFTIAYNEFISDAKKCTHIICHGANFDIGLLYHECIRHNISLDDLHNIQLYDTKYSPIYTQNKTNLFATIDLINANIKDTLSSLNLFPHNALYDSYLCYELYKHTKNKNKMLRTAKSVFDKIIHI